jgi:hypothetical protein
MPPAIAHIRANAANKGKSFPVQVSFIGSLEESSDGFQAIPRDI